MVFCTCALKISNHFINFALRNGELNAKKNVSRDKGVWLWLEISRPMLEKHGSPRNTITRRFRDLISHDFSLCGRIEKMWKKDFEKNSKCLREEFRCAMYSLVSVGLMNNVTTTTSTAVA